MIAPAPRGTLVRGGPACEALFHEHHDPSRYTTAVRHYTAATMMFPARDTPLGPSNAEAPQTRDQSLYVATLRFLIYWYDSQDSVEVFDEVFLG